MTVQKPVSQRELARRAEAVKAAARVFRAKGLASATMDDVAAELGVSKVVLYRRYRSKELLLTAIFEEVLDRIEAAERGSWSGYGSGMRRTLNAIRTVEDGFTLLVREARLLPAFVEFDTRMRAHSAARLRRFLSGGKAGQADDPLMSEIGIEPMVAFYQEALARWVQHGDPAKDDFFAVWIGSMTKAWRSQVSQILGLGDPGLDLPFDPALAPLLAKTVTEK